MDWIQDTNGSQLAQRDEKFCAWFSRLWDALTSNRRKGKDQELLMVNPRDKNGEGGFSAHWSPAEVNYFDKTMLEECFSLCLSSGSVGG